MATTELQSTLSAAQTDIPYGSIATYDGTTITDGSVLALSIDGVVQVLDTDYTVDTVNQDLVLTTPATGGELAVVTRVTDGDDPYVDFTNNTVVDANDLDLALKQLLFLIQETVTSIGDFLSYSSLNAYWDGENRTTSNFMPAATSTGLPTLSQVQDLIAGVSTASIDNVTEWVFEPATPTTAFNLTSAPQGLSDGSELFVWINGVHQRNDVGYTLDATGSTPIVNTASLTSGDVLHVIAVAGTVSTTFSDGSIDTDALADGAVDASKINVGTGDNKRVLVSDTLGDLTARTLVHTDVTDFDAGVQSNRLDQMALPTNTINFNGQILTGVATPSSGGHAATKSYVDSAIPEVKLYAHIETSLAAGSPVTFDVGFAPKVGIAHEPGGAFTMGAIESGDTFTCHLTQISCSGTEITLTSLSGTRPEVQLTIFG